MTLWWWYVCKRFNIQKRVLVRVSFERDIFTLLHIILLLVWLRQVVSRNESSSSYAMAFWRDKENAYMAKTWTNAAMMTIYLQQFRCIPIAPVLRRRHLLTKSDRKSFLAAPHCRYAHSMRIWQHRKMSVGTTLDTRAVTSNKKMVNTSLPFGWGTNIKNVARCSKIRYPIIWLILQPVTSSNI